MTAPKYPSLDDLVAAPNVCSLLTDEQITEIGTTAAEGLRTDLSSRAEWDERNAQAMELALQVVKQKTWPWMNASNVKFPLVTVAAMQYQARAYPALVPGTELVKAKIFGPDPDGRKAALAERVSAHMSWQNLEQDLGWEEEQDKLLLVQAIAGCAFKKRLFDPAKGRQATRLVLPRNFVVNYWTRDIASAERYTETYYLSQNDIRQRIVDKRFRDVNLPEDDKAHTGNSKRPTIVPDAQAQTADLQKEAMDERQGIRAMAEDAVTPFYTAEQYCKLDLDGDGYQEPYIVTFDVGSGTVYRIVARYLPSGIKNVQGHSFGSKEWKAGPKVYHIDPVEFYTKYGFIPSPDGGFYDLGMGALLGPINESVNTGFNLIFDQGTMKALGGGFLGRGFKGKGGAMSFAPNEWKPVDAPGDDIRKQIFPLPTGEPPQLLMQLIGFLVQYAERIVSATEMQVGENVGQNTPAETARTMNENGARVYNAIFKRTWRAERNDYRIQARNDELFLEADVAYPQLKRDGLISIDDYRSMGLTVFPAADPHVVSDTQRIDQAKLLVSNAFQLPGHNKYKALKRLYTAMHISGYEEIMPPPTTQGPNGQTQPGADFPPMPNPKMIEAQNKAALVQLKQTELQSKQMEFKLTLQMELAESRAKVEKMQAETVKLLVEAQVAKTDPLIKMLFAEIESESKRQDRIMKLIDSLMGHAEKMNGDAGNDHAGMGRVEAPPANAGVPAIAAPGGANGSGAMVQ